MDSCQKDALSQDINFRQSGADVVHHKENHLGIVLKGTAQGGLSLGM
jgi:hypothetical protein